MGIVQDASGTFTGTTFTATLPGASSASNRVIVLVAANTTVTTPASWTLRTSQVNFLGHYLYERAGFSLTSVVFTNSAGQGTWYVAEMDGAYDTSLSANDQTVGTTYFTPNLVPTTGAKTLVASLGSTATTGSAARTLSGWTNSFVENADVCQATADAPMQGAASRSATGNGVTTFSTTGTYSASNTGRSAIIASYVDGSGGGASAIPPSLIMQTRRAF